MARRLRTMVTAGALPPGGQIAAAAAGGALGTSVRAALLARHPVEPGAFPWVTFVENLSGALLLGVLTAVLLERVPSTRYLRAFAGTGLLGSYTTFSAFALEQVGLVGAGRPGLAVLYVAASLAGGVAAATAGFVLVRRLPGGVS